MIDTPSSPNADASLTPMMQQYRQAKEQAPGAILLFRMGDFYELFGEDAQTASRLLGLTLTSRDKGPQATPMAGFPYHALEGQLRKLIDLGQKVAICEQVEDPKLAKGLVKREITRIVTPGTLVDDALLDPKSSNIIVAIAPNSPREELGGLAWADLSAGGITLASLSPAEMADELGRLEPTELLFPEEHRPDFLLAPFADGAARTARPGFFFTQASAEDLLSRHFRVKSFGGFGIDDGSPGLRAAGALLAYLLETQRTDLSHISRLIPHRRGEMMVIDPMARRSLEISRTLRDARREGSLLDAIDLTQTAGGSRLLAAWLHQPLLKPEEIRHRQSGVQEWKDDAYARRELRETLARTYDIERLTARISTGRTNPRDLAALRETLRHLPSIKARLTARTAKINADLESSIDLMPEIRGDLEKMLVDEPPFTLREGGIIKAGVHPELDELFDIATGGKQWIAQFQRTETERTGINNLKVGFNKVFGFYIEIPHSAQSKVPASYVRKQTVKNAERYITDELKQYEQKVLGAEERSKSLEYEIFQQLREKVASQTDRLQNLARSLAQLDVLVALAELASVRHYTRPTIDDSERIEIIAGRHPVLDMRLETGRFVPNDTVLGEKHGTLLLLTGPNMAGKSTYIRQVALLTILAQIGSFIPAESATIGVADRVFARVGASDELSRGQSTFMVEMTEAANILNNATSRSLVILDEVGRGTSTYDGVSLAWAMAEHLHDVIACRTLFATHYHELIDLEKTLAGLRNANIAVREWKEEVIFLHQIVSGGADRSYGIHVARLAGVPASILTRAQEILTKLERDPFGQSPASGAPKKHRRQYHQLSLFGTTDHPVLDDIRLLDADTLSPDDAKRAILEWRRRLQEE
jgi:DNA mismatch repair protein MutS